MWQRLTLSFAGLALAAYAMTIMLSAPAEALAGCCKHRADAGNPWSITGLSVEDCKSQNQQDGDNVLKKAGSWWWDISC